MKIQYSLPVLLLILLFGLGWTTGLKADTAKTNEQIRIVDPHNYPNPFKNTSEVTKIKFSVWSGKNAGQIQVSLVVYDFNGKKVWTKRTSLLITTVSGLTPCEIPWGGENDLGQKVASGLYYAKLILEGPNTKTTKIKILVK